MTNYRTRAYIYLLLVAIIWGAAGPIIKYTLGGLDPLPFLAYRFAISGVIAVLYFVFTGFSFSKIKSVIPAAIVYGLLAFTVALSALFTGLDNSTVLDLTLLATISPLIIAAGGAILFRDNITKQEKIGVSIVLLGVIINNFYPFLAGEARTHLSGNLFLLLFLLADTSSVLFAKKAVKDSIPAIALTNIGLVVGAATLIPFVVLSTDTNLIATISALPINYHLGVWYMALLSGNLAYFLWVRGQQSIEVSEAALFYYLQPIFAVPLAVLWLGEHITPHFIVGAILIATGVALAEYKRQRR